MNAAALQLPVMIECEHGYGKLTERACARGHLVAIGKVKVDRTTFLLKKNSKCNGCEHGARRVSAGVLKQAAPLIAAPQYTCDVCQQPFTSPGLRSHAPATCSEPCRRTRAARLALEYKAQREQQAPAPTAERMSLEDVRARLLARVGSPSAPAKDPPRADHSGDSANEVQQQEDETMGEIDRNNLKCVECGARFKGKPTGKIAIVCSAECRTQRQSRAARDRREGTATSASRPVPRATAARTARERPEPAAAPVLAVTEPTPELAAALREPATTAGPASWPYAVSIGRLAIAVRTIDDLAAIVDRYGGSAAHAR
jgi:hypothetical protein